MSLAKRHLIKYNAAHGAGQRGEVKTALLASTTMSKAEISKIFKQLDAYPDDRKLILREINDVINKIGIRVVYVEGKSWQKETKSLHSNNDTLNKILYLLQHPRNFPVLSSL
jgi:hypothetical protein